MLTPSSKSSLIFLLKTTSSGFSVEHTSAGRERGDVLDSCDMPGFTVGTPGKKQTWPPESSQDGYHFCSQLLHQIPGNCPPIPINWSVPHSLPCQTTRSQEIKLFAENTNEAFVLIGHQSVDCHEDTGNRTVVKWAPLTLSAANSMSPENCISHQTQ